ncbi:unnamed protein product, partial [Rotaria sp. Silwood1]
STLVEFNAQKFSELPILFSTISIALVTGMFVNKCCSSWSILVLDFSWMNFDELYIELWIVLLNC